MLTEQERKEQARLRYLMTREERNALAAAQEAEWHRVRNLAKAKRAAQARSDAAARRAELLMAMRSPREISTLALPLLKSAGGMLLAAPFIAAFWCLAVIGGLWLHPGGALIIVLLPPVFVGLVIADLRDGYIAWASQRIRQRRKTHS